MLADEPTRRRLPTALVCRVFEHLAMRDWMSLSRASRSLALCSKSPAARSTLFEVPHTKVGATVPYRPRRLELAMDSRLLSGLLVDPRPFEAMSRVEELSFGRYVGTTVEVMRAVTRSMASLRALRVGYILNAVRSDLDFSALTELATLDLGDKLLTHRTAASFPASLRRLRAHVDAAVAGDEELDIYAHFSSLTAVDLPATGSYGAATVDALLRHAPRLADLSWGGADVWHSTSAIPQLTRLTALRRLALRGRIPAHASLLRESLRAIARTPTLESVDMRGLTIDCESSEITRLSLGFSFAAIPGRRFDAPAYRVTVHGQRRRTD